MLENFLPIKKVLLRLEVDESPKYECFGYQSFRSDVNWQGTLRNTDFKTDLLDMVELPSNLAETESLIVASAYINETYKGKNISVTKYINGVKALKWL